MGEVPLNATGFAHGFRPLEGDHPPPTPTQRDNAISQSVPGGLSAMTQATPAAAQGGAGGMGLRKRRRLPGPLALLQSGSLGGIGQQDGGGASDDDRAQRRSGEESGPDAGEAGGGHFRKGPWLSLCSAIDAPIAEEGASDSETVQAFLRGAVSPISDVLAGDFDLRVPIVTAIIDSYTKLSISDVIVELTDPSGRMKGYLHPGCLEEHGPFLGPGAALLLKEVSIFVSGPGTTRLLNVHPDCVLAVFPADAPSPVPSRLEWLTTCDPPFSPLIVSDSGHNNYTPRETSRRKPPSPSTPTVGRGSRRRRARPPASGESPDGQRQQMTPTLSPPAPLSQERLLQQQRPQDEEKRREKNKGERLQLQDQYGEDPRREQQRRPQLALPGPDGRKPSKEAGKRASLRTPCSEELPPGSLLPSASQGCSPPVRSQSQSQSQSQWQQQIAPGHRSDGADGNNQGAPEDPAATPLSNPIGRGGGARERMHTDLTREDRHPCGRGPSTASTSADIVRVGDRGDYPGLAQGKRGGGKRPHTAPPCTDTPRTVGAGDDCVGPGAEEAGGFSTAEAALSRPTAVRDGLRQREEPARSMAARQSASSSAGVSSGDVAGGSAWVKGASQSFPVAEDRRVRDDGAAGSWLGLAQGGEKVGHLWNKTAGATSIWANLDGVGSGEDSSGDEDVARKSPSSPLRQSLGGTSDSRVLSGHEQPRPQELPQQGQQRVGAEEEDEGKSRDERRDESALLSSVFGKRPTNEQGIASPTAAVTAAPVGIGRAASAGSGTFSLLGGGVSNAVDGDLLDAALDDSD